MAMQIKLIVVVVVVVDSPTVKEPSSETPLRLAELVLNSTVFHSRTIIINKSMVWPWVPKWDPATPVFS